NSGSPVAATLTLGLAFVMAFIVALIQLILFCNLPNRILFLVISGGWLVITYFYGLDWLFRDPVQMKAWAFVCIAMAGVAIVATWRSDLRWRGAGAWALASIALCAVPSFTEWTEGWF